METVSPHLQAKLVKRSEGRNIVAASAYRAGEMLKDDASGRLFDYTRRQVVKATRMMAPEGAPAWMRDRQKLWNTVELNEKRRDSQLARELEISLPAALSDDARQELVWDFCQDHLVAAGMVCDIAIHGPGRGDPRNHHAHILLTMRRIEGSYFADKAREWNDNAVLEGWKAAWEAACNAALEKAEASVRVDRRSLHDRRQALLEQAGQAEDWIERRRLEIAAERLNYTPRPHLPRTPYRAMVVGHAIPPKWEAAVAEWKAATASRDAAHARAAEMERALEAELLARKQTGLVSEAERREEASRAEADERRRAAEAQRRELETFAADLRRQQLVDDAKWADEAPRRAEARQRAEMERAEAEAREVARLASTGRALIEQDRARVLLAERHRLARLGPTLAALETSSSAEDLDAAAWWIRQGHGKRLGDNTALPPKAAWVAEFRDALVRAWRWIADLIGRGDPASDRAAATWASFHEKEPAVMAEWRELVEKEARDALDAGHRLSPADTPRPTPKPSGPGSGGGFSP